MLGTRLVTGFSMAGVLILVLVVDGWLAPWFPLWLVVSLLVTGAASIELTGLLLETSARPSGNTVFGGVAAVVISNWAPHIAAHFNRLMPIDGRLAYDPMTPVDALAWPLITFAAVVMATFVAQSAQFEKPGGTMATIAGTVLAIAYVGVLGSFIIQLRWFDGPHHGLVPLGFLFTTAKGADVGAYTMGRIAGRHKLWPRLSPQKTVEGAVGGLLFAVAGALLVAAIARFLLKVHTMTWPEAVVFGLLVGSAAQLGDLMESMIKRDCARKDASAAVPGFGGVLDVLDSLLFAGPVAFGFWIWEGI